MLRAVLFVASALTTGIAVGRRAASREVERRKTDAVSEAVPVVRERMRDAARAEIAGQLRAFAKRTLVKALVLSVIWFGSLAGVIPTSLLPPLLIAAIALFILFDAFHAWPVLRLVASEVRRHGLRPRQAIGEAVAARVFAEVLPEVGAKMPRRWHEKAFLHVAGQPPERMTEDIARGIADVARQTSWEDLRPFILSGALRMIILTVLYTGFAWLLIARLNPF